MIVALTKATHLEKSFRVVAYQYKNEALCSPYTTCSTSSDTQKNQILDGKFLNRNSLEDNLDIDAQNEIIYIGTL